VASSRTSRATIRALTASMSLAAIVGAVLLRPIAGRPGASLPAVGIAAFFLLAGMAQLNVEFGRQTWSHTLSEVPLVIGLFSCAPWQLLPASALGGLLAMVMRGQRQRAKMAFNASMFACEAGVAVLVQQLLLPATAGPIGPRAWGATFVAVLAADIFSLVAVLTAIRVTRGRLDRGDLAPLVGPALLSGALNCTVALVALLTVRANGAALALLVVVAVGLALAYRGYSSLLRRHNSLGLVNTFTRVVARLNADGAQSHGLLEEVRAALSCERAELCLPLAGGRAARSSRDGEELSEDEVTLEWLRVRVLETGRSVLVPRRTRDPELRAWLAAEGLRDAIAVPLPGDDGPAGVLLVGDRQGSSSHFRPDDVTVLETLAAHVAVGLSNGSLLTRLRHDALHDGLTGLANRTLLGERLATALAQDLERADGRQTAVALIDLDGFKDVNDTLGHHSGDALLQETARRLLAVTAGWPCVARLGGDEFAVLFPPAASAEEAVAGMRRVLEAVQQPYVLDGLEIAVRGSAGVAVHDDGARDASVLLRRADMAMYAAKAAAEGVRLFSRDLDSGSPERLALAGELRKAIEAGAVQVHFQPKAELGTGRVCGLEALARWDHPTRGPISPDVFVALAEHTGLVGALTALVLHRAVQQCAQWQADGLDVGVAVNLSVRSLTDAGLPALVSSELAGAGLAPRHLTLEITESSVMSEPGRTLPVLHTLAGLGVRLSVDDFGTGYSSLSYLQRLPVCEVKVDKSFVRELGIAGPGTAIVRAVVDLGHSLGLTVVAEGVEDQRTQDQLTELGCDVIQGWHLERALPAAAATTFLQGARQVPLPTPLPSPALGATLMPLRLVGS